MSVKSRFKVAFDNVESNVGDICKKMMLDLDAEIVAGTPVDKGRARSNWVPAIGEPSALVTDAKDLSGSDTTQRAQKMHAESPNFSIMFLSNNLPYIQPLEDGHSQQAPEGWIKLAVQRIASIFK